MLTNRPKTSCEMQRNREKKGTLCELMEPISQMKILDAVFQPLKSVSIIHSAKF